MKISIQLLYPYIQDAAESMDTFYMLMHFCQPQLVAHSEHSVCQLFLDS
jgi:hypothetical protein